MQMSLWHVRPKNKYHKYLYAEMNHKVYENHESAGSYRTRITAVI